MKKYYKKTINHVHSDNNFTSSNFYEVQNILINEPGILLFIIVIFIKGSELCIHKPNLLKQS